MEPDEKDLTQRCENCRHWMPKHDIGDSQSGTCFVLGMPVQVTPWDYVCPVYDGPLGES